MVTLLHSPVGMDGAEHEPDAEASTGTGAGGDVAARFTDDLVLEILSRLPAKSLCRCKCVSRHWRGLISHPDRRRKLAQTLAGFFYVGYTWDVPRDCPVKSLNFASACPPPAVDPSPSALSVPPGYEQVHRLDGCNGLLLLRCWKPGAAGQGFRYAVCNPVTEVWAALPDSRTRGVACSTARLVFDPAASGRHFRVFEFGGAGATTRSTAVEIYSSESGAWTHRDCGWGDGAEVTLRDESRGVFFDGMLRLAPIEPVIVSVDLDGKTWRSDPKPSDPDDDGFIGGPAPGFITRSQGRLRFLNTLEYNHQKLCVWDLEDDGVWVLKHGVDLRMLFGRLDYRVEFKCSVVGVHPHCNLIYFVDGENNTLVSYAMDRGETCPIRDLGRDNYAPYLPYVPLFSVSIAA